MYVYSDPWVVDITSIFYLNSKKVKMRKIWELDHLSYCDFKQLYG